MISLLVALFVSLACSSETSWIEYDHDANAFVGVCGDANGQALPGYLVANHSLAMEINDRPRVKGEK